MKKKRRNKNRQLKQLKQLKQIEQTASSIQSTNNQADTKPKSKRKKHVHNPEVFRLSWLTKVSNADFLATTDILLDKMEHWIKGKTMIPDAPFNRARKYIDQMRAMAPKQLSHNSTATIHEMHADRKRQLTAIRTYIKLMLKPHFAQKDNERTYAADRLAKLFKQIFGTRHYDLGISALNARIGALFSLIDEDSTLQEALTLCDVDLWMQELRESTEQFDAIYLKRDIEMSGRKLEASFPELRAKIYKEICLLVRWVGDLIDMTDDNQIYIAMRNIFYHYLTPKRANYLQQRTKRRLRREVAQAVQAAQSAQANQARIEEQNEQGGAAQANTQARAHVQAEILAQEQIHKEENNQELATKHLHQEDIPENLKNYSTAYIKQSRKY